MDGLGINYGESTMTKSGLGNLPNSNGAQMMYTCHDGYEIYGFYTGTCGDGYWLTNHGDLLTQNKPSCQGMS